MSAVFLLTWQENQQSFFHLHTWEFLFFPFESAVFHFQRSTTFYDRLPAILMSTVRLCLLSTQAGSKKRMCALGEDLVTCQSQDNDTD